MGGKSQAAAMLRKWVFGMLATIVVLGCAAPAALRAEEDLTAKREQLFREGVDLYQQRRYSEAQAKLRLLLETQPRNELIARLVDEAGVQVLAQMMSNRRMGNEPAYVWELYRKYYRAKLADAQRMQKMAARVVDPEVTEEERSLLYREFAELGHYAVPYLAPYLNAANRDDFRSYSRVVLARMGAVAVLPLIALLDHKDVLMREGAIMTLSEIQPLDPRAIPALKARLEDPQETPTTKRLATRALERVTGLPGDKLKPATQYYYEEANRYYLERSTVAEEARQADGYLWHLNAEGNLVPVLYPIWAWNEQMAEELVLRGMSLQVDQTDYYPLAACIYGAQYMEVKDLVDLIGEQRNQHFFSAEEQEEVKKWNEKLIDCENLAAACGKYYVNEGLFKVLRDLNAFSGHPKLPGVGVFLCRLLKDLDPEGDLLELPPPPPVPAAPAPVVVEKPKPEPSQLTCIEVYPSRAYVHPGGTQQYQAVAKDQRNKKMAGITFAWSVEGGGTIDQNGLFTAGPASGEFPVYAQATNLPPSDPGQPATAEAKGKAEASVEQPVAKNPGETETKPALSGAQPARIPGESDRMTFPHSSALVAALDATDRWLVYEASLALGLINRFPIAWRGQERVAGLLGRGVSEFKPLQVLVVEEDHNTRNKVRQEIEALGLNQTDAASGRDAVLLARSFPPKDIILISDKIRRDFSAEQLLEELRADVRTRYIPIGILHDTENRTAIQSRFGVEIPLVERTMKGNDLKLALEKLEQGQANEALPKRQAHEIAKSCAEVLAGLYLNSTNLTLADAVPHCESALKNRKDDVRLPAARFLGNAKGGTLRDQVADSLLAVALNKDNEIGLRLAAMKSVGQVKPEAFADTYQKLQTQDEPHLLQLLAAINFGKHLRTNKQLLEILREKRVDRAIKEK